MFPPMSGSTSNGDTRRGEGNNPLSLGMGADVTRSTVRRGNLGRGVIWDGVRS